MRRRSVEDSGAAARVHGSAEGIEAREHRGRDGGAARAVGTTTCGVWSATGWVVVGSSGLGAGVRLAGVGGKGVSATAKGGGKGHGKSSSYIF